MIFFSTHFSCRLLLPHFRTICTSTIVRLRFPPAITCHSQPPLSFHGTTPFSSHHGNWRRRQMYMVIAKRHRTFMIKTISFAHGFGDESLVLNPSPPTCHRLDHHGISDALAGDDCLARTFHRGSIVVVNFYVQAKCVGNLLDIQLVPTEWIIIGQSDGEFVVRNFSRSYASYTRVSL